MLSGGFLAVEGPTCPDPDEYWAQNCKVDNRYDNLCGLSLGAEQCLYELIAQTGEPHFIETVLPSDRFGPAIYEITDNAEMQCRPSQIYDRFGGNDLYASDCASELNYLAIINGQNVCYGTKDIEDRFIRGDIYQVVERDCGFFDSLMRLVYRSSGHYSI